MSAALVRRLADAGLDAAAIVAALEAFEAVEEERKAAKRAGNRERQARRREREKAPEATVTRDNAPSRVTDRDTPAPSLPSPPDPPTPPTPTHGEQSRTRKGRPRAKPEHPETEAIWRAANQASRDRSGIPATSAAIAAALEAGATAEAIRASVASHCRATGDHAKGVHRIVEAKFWRDHLAKPPDTAQPADPQVLAGRLAHFSKTGEWRPEWGDRPANDTRQTGAAA